MRYLLLFCLFFLFNNCYAQYYQVGVLQQTYTEITNPTYEIEGTSPFFGNVNTKPEVQFTSFGKIYDLSEDVFIPIKQGYAYFINATHSTTVYAAEGSFIARTNAPASTVFSFATDTSGGDKKFIMQWKNMGFATGDTGNYVNFQLCLYQNSQVVEMRYGPSSVKPGIWENGANGPTVGLLEMDENFSTIYNQQWLSGNPASPQTVTTNTVVNLNTVPANGTVYRFSPMQSGLSESSPGINARIYPNPAADKLHIETNSPLTMVEMFDLSGKKIHEQANGAAINVSNMVPGMYFIRINETFCRKISIR